MYTGHVGIALAVRGVRDDLPLWALIAIAQACDWVEFVVYPHTPGTPSDLYSHAFPFVVIGAVTAALAVWLWKRSARAAAIAMALYLSHPLLDFVTGLKPLWLGGPSVGLGFIYRPMADFVTQGLVCAVGVAVYCQSLPPARRRQIAAVAPLVFLLALQAASDVRLEWLKRRREHRESIQRELTWLASQAIERLRELAAPPVRHVREALRDGHCPERDVSRCRIARALVASLGGPDPLLDSESSHCRWVGRAAPDARRTPQLHDERVEDALERRVVVGHERL